MSWELKERTRCWIQVLKKSFLKATGEVACSLWDAFLWASHFCSGVGAYILYYRNLFSCLGSLVLLGLVIRFWVWLLAGF